MTTTKKISELTDAGDLQGDEFIPVVQDGATRKTTVDDVRDGLSEVGHNHVLANISDAGTAASKPISFFATAAQGAKADTAIQAADLGSAAYVASSTFATATQGAKADTAIQPAALGTAAYVASSTFATAAQGAKADTAVQPASLGTAAYAASSSFATAAQGAKADTAVQPASLATVATTGAYNNLINAPYPGLINAVINGGCLISQRSDKTLSGTYQYGPIDLLAVKADGTITAGTITKGANNYSLATTGAYSLISGCTITGSGVIYWRYRIESKDAWAFYNQGAYCSARGFQDTGSGKTATITVRKANAVDDFSATTQIATGNTTLTNGVNTDVLLGISSMGDCRNGIEIEVKIACGAVTTKNFHLSELQLSIGNLKRSFERRPMALETKLVHRYLQPVAGIVAVANSASNMQAVFQHPDMRTAPTYEALGALDMTDGYTADFSQSSAHIGTIHENNNHAGRADIALFSGLTSGRFYIQRSTSDFVLASAEL